MKLVTNVPIQARKPAKLYNLEQHKKVNGEWVHHMTRLHNAPYSLCKGIKLQYEMHKSHFEFYKIVLNKTT